MDFVDEKKCALPNFSSRARGIECLLEVGNAREHRRELLEMELESGREQPRDGGLAGARRAPEHDRMRPSLRDHPSDRALGLEQMILAHHFGKRLGPQAIGQRPGSVIGQSTGFEKVTHGGLIPPPRGEVDARSAASTSGGA